MAAEVDTFETEFVPRRQAWTLFGVLLAGFLGWCGLSLLLPHDRYIRYQQLTDSDLFRTRWVYERIHYDKTPIDVAIVGSSRVEAAISAPILEQELSTKFGRPIHVANLAIPEEGRNLHYLVARELLETHPETRILLVSVVEQADNSHFAFRYLGDVKDLLGAPLVINHDYFLDASFLPYRQMSYFVQTLFPRWFGVSRAPRKDYFGTGFDTTNSFYLPTGKLIDRSHIMPEDKLAEASRKMVGDFGARWRRPSKWHALNYPLETGYVQRLAGEARSHCVETIFVHLPFYNSPPHLYDEEFYRGLGPLVDAQELSANPRNYGDAGHFNRNGTDQVSPWLRKAIDPYLEPLGNPGSCTR